MSRLKLVLILLFLPAALRAATAPDKCDLQMSVTCTTQGSTSSCRATTVNAGTQSCTGFFYVGWVAQTSAKFGAFNNGLGLSECLGDLDLPPGFDFSGYDVCFGEASLGPNGSFTSTIQVSGTVGAASIPVIGFTGVFDPVTDDAIGLTYAVANVAPPSCTPAPFVLSTALSGDSYDVTWSAVSDPNTTFQIDESTSANFTSGVTTRTVAGLRASYQHAVTTDTKYYYRVRATSCGGVTGPNSPDVSIVVTAGAKSTDRGIDVVVSLERTTPVQFPLFIPEQTGLVATATVPFTTVTDKPYVTVSPSSGTIPPGGTTLTVTVSPAGLPAGANTGTVTVLSGSTVLVSQTVTVSKVTPVGPGTKSLPSSNTLVIPVVTHVNGASAQFLSDVRLTNASSSEIKYQLTFTPTRTDATKTSKVTVVPVGAAQTVALNDIAKDFFGYGVTSDPNDVGFGSLEIRPLDTASALSYASSRTYAVNALGTLGQFIAALPFSKFATNAAAVPLPGAGGGVLPASVLSLQQVAQSLKFRTNLGLVEGSGTPASGRIRVLDDLGTLLKEVPYSLLPGEHQQLNAFIANNAGIPSLEDGRLEITVDSPTGAVSGYASVLDNVTTDPLAVMPVAATSVKASRYVLPGMADIPGDNNFHSDVRIYNAGTTSAVVTPTYYPQNNGAPVNGQPITIPAGHVKAIDNILPTTFNQTGSGGSVVLTTQGDTSLVATGRTYTVTTVNGQQGTFGQFIPGVTPAEGIGAGDRPLQVLQLEQSRNFRSNVGLAELTGNPVDVELVATLPDSKTSAVLTKHLNPSEFFQFGSILAGMVGDGSNVYNARITVKVTGGTGRVTAYGSVIDNQSKDPTYVQAQ